MITHQDITWKNGQIDIWFEFEAGFDAPTDRYGQMESPGAGDEYNITKIEFEGKDITALFDEDDFDLIIDELISIRETALNDYDGE